MTPGEIDAFLQQARCGRLGTIGADGWPYVCPLLFVWAEGKLWFHNTAAEGHLQANVRHSARACFEVDVIGEVFAYGRYDCDTSIEYRSVIAFGNVAIEDDSTRKAAFMDRLMEKYHPERLGRPASFYPRLDAITLYSLAIERMTGKTTPLPSLDGRWPATDSTKSPLARPQ